MAEEFHSGICSQNWWDISSSNVLCGGVSPCSTAVNDISSGYAWQTNSVADSSVVLQDDMKLPQQQADSNIKMMDFGLSSTVTSDWNQSILSGRAESTYNSMLQEDMNSKLNYQQETGISSSQILCASSNDSTISAYKPIDTESSGSCTEPCHGFPVGSCSSTLLQNLVNPQPQETILSNQSSMSYQSTRNYGTQSNELLSSCPKFSPFMKPSLPHLQPAGGMQLSGNRPFWNASAMARASFLPSSQTSFVASSFEQKPSSCHSLTTKIKSGVQDVKKNGIQEHETQYKRPRIETPSPLPTFKVRKEKLGDRITALQQLVSPFGKTDTASVLHEAIEYIKLLHNQVSISCTPYMNNGAANVQQQDAEQVLKDSEEPNQDLKSRGLCLVPITRTFPVANETTTADFWTPTFGGTFRF